MHVNNTDIPVKDPRTVMLEHEKIPKLLLHYAIPAVIGMLVNGLYNVVDRIFIGQGAGEYAIAGLTITFPILIFMQAFGMLIGSGASARVSIYLGKHNRDGADAILGNAIILTLITQLLCIVPVMIWMKPLLIAFGASERTLPYAVEYLTIVVPGNILTTLSFGYNAIMRASGYPKKAMWTMIIGALTNIILDALFIFGFGWGIRGAAWATFIAMLVSAVWVMHHFFSKNSLVRFRRSAMKLSWKESLEILSIGISPFLMQLLSSVVNVVINRSFVGYASTSQDADIAIAAYGILNSFAMIGVMFVLGISQGMQPIVGYNYGARLYGRVLQTFKTCLSVNIAVSGLTALSALIFPYALTRLFTTSETLTNYTVTAIRVGMCAFVFVGVQISSTQFFQSMGMPMKAMVLSLSRQVIFLLPLLIILPVIIGGLIGVWLALPLSDALSGALAITLVVGHVRRMKRMTHDTAELETETEKVID
ncbi:Staphylococcal virulence regulator protein A [Porphyromonas macacae]|uniref:Multidrug export protein MepA n=1 Tax=Porphyromonas macacae TaxID=28115 RepID=A0A379DK84_9PORP|nr:MATE family efflux transporter [Porphyromonas macacae]SUB78423.1 Staphylococcal virulence regulator protein A [Porphyromonas macacae]